MSASRSQGCRPPQVAISDTPILCSPARHAVIHMAPLLNPRSLLEMSLACPTGTSFPSPPKTTSRAPRPASPRPSHLGRQQAPSSR